jgi:predicted enzyme related to lactoylglutathione lyase
MLTFDGVLIGSANPKALADFYSGVIGQPPGWDQDEFRGWQLGSSYFMVGPHSEVSGRNSEPARILINFAAENVIAESARIKQLGAQVVAEPYQPDGAPDGMLLATFADPDGNYFQLGTPMPADAQPPA